VVSQRKGFTRYWTPEIRVEVDALSAAEERRSVALANVLKNLLASFGKDFSMWKQVAQCMGEVDCLASLAVMARGMDQPCCRPLVLDDADGALTPPALMARGLRHPCLSLDPSRTFIPNDTELGGPAPHFLLLTGPNMGGKSTLLRQVCLATVLAQAGAWVPAESFSLVPVDRLFVRMGARDNILAGESTFFVELAETAAMLRGATRRSLVALDELGRGTSTSDGAAIAHAVTQHLTRNVGCRAMFATHYHTLSEDFAPSGSFSLRHMGCDVTGASAPSSGAAPPLASATSDADVTFLYKLCAGPCPRSFGLNVARLAGMPEPVVKRAAEQGRLMEQMFMEKANKSRDGPDDGAADGQGDGTPASLSGEEIRLLRAVMRGGAGGGAGGGEPLASLSRRVRSSFVF
jgi:DNA mismatch repair protein MSH6